MDNNQNSTQPPAPAPTIPAPSPNTTSGKNRTELVLGIVGICLAIAIIAGVSAWGVAQNNAAKNKSNEIDTLKDGNKKLAAELKDLKESTGEENIDKTLFQSVFLKNGQVYFGKITKLTANQITLENIYYLKTASPGVNVDKLEGDVSLVKLGSELHGPQDVMYIERKEVQFWENLKADGQVAKAIEQYVKQN